MGHLKYEGIKEIRILTDDEISVNRALELEWVLLEIIQEHHGEGGVFSKELTTKTYYIVGRTKESIKDPQNWIEHGTYEMYGRVKPTREG